MKVVLSITLPRLLALQLLYNSNAFSTLTLN